MMPIANPAERPPAIGIPRDEVSPIWVTLSKDKIAELRINANDPSSFTMLTEIICCCSRYNNNANTPPATNIIILIIFFRKYPTITPIKKPQPTDVTVGIRLSAFIVFELDTSVSI